MAWPILDAWGEIPSPRLLADVPVSVSGFELAPLTIAAKDRHVFEATAGRKAHGPARPDATQRVLRSHAATEGVWRRFRASADVDVPLTADSSQAVLDLAG